MNDVSAKRLFGLHDDEKRIHDQYSVFSVGYISPTITAMGGGGRMPHILTEKTMKNELRIRKLTPKECWRLMGFKDEEFERAESAGISNTQLYKQAGNSIVVDTLVNGVFKYLFTEGVLDDKN